MAHNITFSPDAWADYLYWQSEDKKTLKRINKLLQELQRDGAVQGMGKSEILRGKKGMSKRIDKENRLEYFNALEVYAVEGNLAPFAEMVANLTEHQLDCYLEMAGVEQGTGKSQSM